MALDTLTLESPLAELDQAITNFSIGADDISQLNLGAFNSKTISSGAITGDKTLITVDTEASASEDDLDNITGGSAGDVIFLKIANSSRIVNIRSTGGGTGNIRTRNTLTVRIGNATTIVCLINDGTNWIVTPTNFGALNNTFYASTIASGAITFVTSYMSVDTEASASSDDLDTISGGALGSFLFLSTANSNRDVTIKHNTGNIKTPNGVDIVLDSIDKFVLLVNNSVGWVAIQSPVNFKQTQGSITVNTNFSNFGVPYQSVVTTSHPLASTTQPFFNIVPNTGLRQVRTLQAADTTLEGYGFGTLTVSGTGSNNYGVGSTPAPGSFVRFASGGSSGNLGGVISPFTLTSLQAYPTFRIIFRTYSSISVCRFWIGLSSAAIGNTDSPSSAGTHFIGVRYSTVVPDSFWQFVTSDGSTTTASSTGVSAATDNTYELLVFSADSNSSVLYFRNIANSTYASLTTTTTLPATTTALGLNARVETREAVAKSLQIYGVSLYH